MHALAPDPSSLNAARKLSTSGGWTQEGCGGEPLSVFYTSNVEFYLAREGTFERFVDNLSRIPHRPAAVIIRSVFGGFNRGSTSVTEKVDDVLAPRRR